jgi:hypothetical protein
MGGEGRGRLSNRVLEDDALSRKFIQAGTGVAVVAGQAEVIEAQCVEGDQDDIARWLCGESWKGGVAAAREKQGK